MLLRKDLSQYESKKQMKLKNKNNGLAFPYDFLGYL